MVKVSLEPFANCTRCLYFSDIGLKNCLVYSNVSGLPLTTTLIQSVDGLIVFSLQPSYVLHIFPPCDFAQEHLARVSPDLLDSAADSGHLMVVVASV